MTYQILDNVLTTLLTGTLYGGALFVSISFIVFVASHDLAQPEVQQQQPEVQPEVQQQQPEVEQPEVQPEVQQQQLEEVPEVQQPKVEQLEEVPVDFGAWKVTDLKLPALVKALDIPLKDGKRLLRKAELIAHYQAALAS